MYNLLAAYCRLSAYIARIASLVCSNDHGYDHDDSEYTARTGDYPSEESAGAIHVGGYHVVVRIVLDGNRV